MGLWADGNREQAIEILEAALEDSAGPFEDQWWHSISRGLAQIALEVDDLNRADRHLRLLQDGEGTAQTSAIRGRRWLLAGDRFGAAAEVAAAANVLAAESADDVGSLMNGAIALVSCAEVLVELGYGREAMTTIDSARLRIAEAGVHDPILTTKAAMAEAGAARLVGDPESASGLLATVDTTEAADLAISVTREQARLAWDANDQVAALSHYDQAIADAVSGGYVSLARMISIERRTGPPRPQHDLNAWIEERTRHQLDGLAPYAVVIRLVVDQHADRFNELETRIAEMLAATPSLGSVDGTGTDGEIWELFLIGDDRDALWTAVRPLVDEISPALGSQVDVRQGDATETMPLA